MDKAREFWIEPNGKKEITPWRDNPVEYRSYQCLDLPGGFWKNRAIHVIEYRAYQDLQARVQELEKKLELVADCLDHLAGHTTAHLQFPHKDTSHLTLVLMDAREILKNLQGEK